MPVTHRITNITPQIYTVPYSRDANNQPYFTQSQLYENLQFIAGCINADNNTPVSLAWKWNVTPTDNLNIVKSHYDWLINLVFDDFHPRIISNKDKIENVNLNLSRKIHENWKILTGREVAGTPEFLEGFIWHNAGNRAVNVGLLTSMMETEKYLWEFLYGSQGITGTHFQEMINWINPTGRMETFGIIPLLIETLKVQWDLLVELGKIDVKDLQDSVTNLENEIYVSSLFTIPGDENRISGLERELTRNQGRRLEHIDDLLEAIYTEIGGYKIDEYRFVDSRLARLESGAKGVWNEDRIVIIEDKAEQNRVDIENIDWETYKPEIDDWIKYKTQLISAIETEIPALKLNVSNIATQLVDLKSGKIPNIETSLATLKTKIDNLQIPNIENLESRMSAIETWKTNLIIPDTTIIETRILKLETWKNTLEIPNLSAIKTEIETIKQSITDLKIPDLTDLETWKDEITIWKDTLEIPDLTETLSEIEDIKLRIEELEETDFSSLVQRLGELEDEIKAVPISSVSGLSQKLKLLAEDIAAIEVPDIAPLENLITSVLGIISGIVAPDISGLRSQLMFLENVVSKIIIPDIEPLTLRISSLENLVQISVADKISVLEKALDTLTSDNEKILELIILIAENPVYLLPAFAGKGFSGIHNWKNLSQYLITRSLE